MPAPVFPANPDWQGEDPNYRQRVAKHYLKTAILKKRLKITMWFHLLLTFLMLFKITPYFLDRLNIFVLPVEELEIPEPVFWEFIWLLSIFMSVIALRAMKYNTAMLMKYYIYGITLLGWFPMIFGLLYWFPDIWSFVFNKNLFQISHWNNRPLGVMWLTIIIPAFQIHWFAMFFAKELMDIWQERLHLHRS